MTRPSNRLHCKLSKQGWFWMLAISYSIGVPKPCNWWQLHCNEQTQMSCLMDTIRLWEPELRREVNQPCECMLHALNAHPRVWVKCGVQMQRRLWLGDFCGVFHNKLLMRTVNKINNCWNVGSSRRKFCTYKILYKRHFHCSNLVISWLQTDQQVNIE